MDVVVDGNVELNVYLNLVTTFDGQSILVSMATIDCARQSRQGRRVRIELGHDEIKGGFVLARRAFDRKELVDTTFAVEAVKDHVARFGGAAASLRLRSRCYSQGAIADRGQHRRDQELALQRQSPSSTFRRDDGHLRAARCLGIQPHSHSYSLSGRSNGVKIDAIRIYLKGTTPPAP